MTHLSPPDAAGERILGMDLGTSSVRALVLDAAARPLPGALARRPAVVAVDGTGAATIDPAAYLHDLFDCLDELAAGGHLDGVTRVAVSAQWHSVLAIDPGGAPLGPVLTWLDTRPEPPSGAPGPADPEAFHARTGCWWHGLYWTVRLPWLRAHYGVDFTRFVGLAEFVFAELLTEAPMSISHASGTGLLDIAGMDWDPEACALAGVRPKELPPLAPRDWFATLRPEYARRWPALRDARWAPAVGDGAASTVASGGVDGRDAVITVGTSAAVRLIQPAARVAGGAGPATGSGAAGTGTAVGDSALPPLPYRLWRYRVDHDRVVTGAAYSNGGNLYAWAQRELRLPSGDALSAALDRVEPGMGVEADPRFGGDRPPGRAPAGSGRFCGIGFTTTSVEMLAGLLYAVCRQAAADVVELESTVNSPLTVRLGGGAVVASAWWRRAFRVALAPRSVHDVSQPEVGAVGAALIVTGQAS